MMEILKRIYRITRAYIYSYLSPPERDWYYQPFSGIDHDSFSQETSDHEPGPTKEPDLASYYACLEVPYGADLTEVKNAWRRLMKKYHPDLYSTDPEKYRLATILTQELTHAYKEIEKAHRDKKGGEI